MTYKPKNPIGTMCRDCVHALWDGLKQVGCATGVLDRHRDTPGVSVETHREPEGDPPGRESFVVDGMLCRHKRPLGWTGTAEDLRAELRDRVRVRAFVVANGSDPGPTFATLRSLRNFASVGVLKGDDPPPRPVLAAWLRENCQRWTLDWPLAGGSDWRQLLDDAVRKCDSTFYVVTGSGRAVPEDLVDQIVTAVVDRDRVFLALEHADYAVVQTYAHNAIGGNAAAEAADGSGDMTGVVAKLRHAGEDRGEAFVLPAGEVLGETA